MNRRKGDPSEEISEYQARQYNAVIFGYRRGGTESAQRYARLIDRLIRSRRTWQARTLEADARMERVAVDADAIRKRNGRLSAVANTLWDSRRRWQEKAIAAGKATKEAVAQRDRTTELNRKRRKLHGKIWASRRRWQARALKAEDRKQIALALCALEQLRAETPDAPVKSDWVSYALDPKFFTKPTGWDEVYPVLVGERRGGPEGVTV